MVWQTPNGNLYQQPQKIHHYLCTVLTHMHIYQVCSRQMQLMTSRTRAHVVQCTIVSVIKVFKEMIPEESFNLDFNCGNGKY